MDWRLTVERDVPGVLLFFDLIEIVERAFDVFEESTCLTFIDDVERTAALAKPITEKQAKTKNKIPFFLIHVKCYQKNFLVGNKKMHRLMHFF